MNQIDEHPLPATQEETLRRLEARIGRIEAYLQLGPLPQTSAATSSSSDAQTIGMETDEEKETALELKIGEFWLARVGMVALLMGTAFFIAYPISVMPPLLHSMIGYLAVAGLLGASRLWQSSYPFLSRILFGGGLLLLYYATLRLHFFTASPLIASKGIAIVLLLLVTGAHFVLAARRKSELLAVTAGVLGFATAIVVDSTHISLPIVALTSAIMIYFLLYHAFYRACLFGVLAAYFVHVLWLLSNPFMGHPIQAVAAHQNNLVYLFVYAILFAAPALLRAEDSLPDAARIVLPLFNGIGFCAIAFLNLLTFFEHERAVLNLAISAFFLAAAIGGWILRRNRYATSFYACFGYLALSAAIFARFAAPHYFIWLGWQSLLVISTAIWFRSKIVVIANAFIYLGIFLAYLVSSPSNGAVNVSYAIVALLSARLLNWKTERLALKTELMRYGYLASAFVIIPYGLYHAVPQNYVSLSWLGAALFYFAMSLILKNKKYRWMAILTIFLAVIHVFAIDMARLEAAYRILSFIALGVVLLAISLLYARSHKKASAS